MIHNAYKAVMSRGDDIKIDPNELQTVMQGAAMGSLIRVRQGIINPSFLVSIVEDKERRAIFMEDTKYDTGMRGNGMRALKDIFADSPLQITSPKK